MMSVNNVSDKNFDLVIVLPFCHFGLCFEHHSLIASEYLHTSVKPFSSNKTEIKKVANEIEAYCQNPEFSFQIEIDPQGTAFQRKVWKKLLEIPAGEVKTYGQLAKELSSSARAIGNACRANPLPLIIPCHRVVSANGLGGFSGYKTGYFTDIKRQLLHHEGLEF